MNHFHIGLLSKTVFIESVHDLSLGKILQWFDLTVIKNFLEFLGINYIK